MAVGGHMGSEGGLPCNSGQELASQAGPETGQCKTLLGQGYDMENWMRNGKRSMDLEYA
jgi:hypothetical protein